VTLTSQEIEQIVLRVMDHLHPREPNDGVHLPPLGRGGSGERAENVLSLPDPVITHKLLDENVNGAKTIRIAPRAILTPSARDFLRTRGIDCVREELTATSNPANTVWQMIISTASPGIDAAFDQLRTSGVLCYKKIVGVPAEAAQHAVSAICRGETAGVVVFSGEPELVACLANRNDRVRAAVVTDASR